jgi:hypothetical protein
MNADQMNDDELHFTRVYATVAPPPTLGARYHAALDRARSSGAHGGERRSLRPLAAALAVAVVAAGGGVTAARLGFARGHVAGPGPAPVRSATPNPTPSLTVHGPLIPWAALPPTGAYPQAANPSPTAAIPVPPGTPACRASQLEVGLLGFQGATGHTDMPLALRNRSGAACVLNGYPYVTVVDAGGRALAPVNGNEFRDTFFDQLPALPVLMLAETPPLPVVTPGPQQGASRGQAVMNLTWVDCRHPQAARLWLDLPSAGGRLVVPFATAATSSPACDGNPGLPSELARGPLLAAGFTTLPSPDYIATVLTVSAPAQVRRGTTLVYHVTLSNTDARPYPLDPCPDFNEFVGAKQAIARYQLNCTPAGSLAPGAQVTFEVHLDFPAAMTPGPYTLEWALIDGRLEKPYADAPITVVS